MCKTINQRLNDDKEFNAAIDILFKHKPERKIIQKAVEELMELATKLMQDLNDPDKLSDAEIVEEIVDVNMHLILIEKLFGQHTCKRLVGEKVRKFLSSKSLAKYASKEAEAA